MEDDLEARVVRLRDNLGNFPKAEFILVSIFYFKKSHYFCAVFKYKITFFYKETDTIFNITYLLRKR
jgi:hypothetical protein